MLLDLIGLYKLQANPSDLCYPDTRVLIFLPSRIPRTRVGFRHPCRIPSVICRVPKNSNESDTRTRVGHRHPHPCPCNTIHIKWLPSFCLLQTCLIGLLLFFFFLPKQEYKQRNEGPSPFSFAGFQKLRLVQYKLMMLFVNLNVTF